MLEFENHFFVRSPSAKRKLSTRFNVNTAVGTATFTFKAASTATLSYPINGVSGTKEIEREMARREKIFRCHFERREKSAFRPHHEKQISYPVKPVSHP